MLKGIYKVIKDLENKYKYRCIIKFCMYPETLEVSMLEINIAFVDNASSKTRYITLVFSTKMIETCDETTLMQMFNQQVEHAFSNIR